MWVKLDDQFPDHPKVLAAGLAGELLFIHGLCYCARYLTDGFIRQEMLGRLLNIADLEDVAQRLIDVGLWKKVRGGYQVHDYLQYNPSAEQVKADRAENARRQNEWRERHRNDAGRFQRNGVTNDEVTSAPSPYPSPNPRQSPYPSEGGAGAPHAPHAPKSRAKSRRKADEYPPQPA